VTELRVVDPDYGSILCSPYTHETSSIITVTDFDTACTNAKTACNQLADPGVDIDISCVYYEMRQYDWCFDGTEYMRQSLIVTEADDIHVSDGVVLADSTNYPNAGVSCSVQCYVYPD
jgi:hypothetical protein